MSLKHEINRIAHLLNDGVHKTEKRASHWIDSGARQAAELDRRVREQARVGRRGLTTAEEAVVSHMRENRAFYLLGAAMLVGVLIAKLVFETRRTAIEPPLL